MAGIAPEFANIWTISIQKKENSGKPLPDLHKIVELFRNNLRMINARKGIPQSGFSSSYQGKPIDDDGEQAGGAPSSKTGSNPPGKRNCLCGVVHYFSQYPYIVESVRASDWKPDPQIKKQVDKKIKAESLGLKTVIIKAQNRAKDKKNKKEKPTPELPADEKLRKGSFPVYIFVAFIQSDYHL